MASITNNYKGYKNMTSVLDLRGLDMVTPVDLLTNGHTPYSKNFRLYAPQADDRKVAVSNRKGPGYYITPLNETLSVSNTATTGSGTAEVGLITGIHAQPFVAASNDRLTRIDIRIANTLAAGGPVKVEIYSDNTGPYKLLTESSLLNGDISGTTSYVTARFINSIKLTSGSTYWIVLQVQDDGKNSYTVSTTTAGTMAWKSDSTLSQLLVQTYGLNFKVFTALDIKVKGGYRFNRDNGQNTTVVVYDQTLYMVDESTHSLVSVLTGLSASAQEYRFDNADNKVFWVNGYDQLTNWNGIHESVAQNLVSNGTFESSVTGWTAPAGSTVARITTQHNTGTASMYVSSAGSRGADFAMTLSKGVKYKVELYVRVDSATTVTVEAHSATVNSTVATQACSTGTWTNISTYYTPTDDKTYIRIVDATQNFCVDDVVIISTGIETITDPDLPILSDFAFHKNRAWGKTAADENKLVFSEDPGNPVYDPTGLIATTANQQWYYAWLSISFIYVPRPHNGSPVTWMGSFQDSLTVTTADKKYVISGSDRGSFNLRESTGSKGALSARGVVADENKIYLVANDGLYEHNGSQDKKLSGNVSPLFDGCPSKENITPVLWKNEVRFYLASQGSTVNDSCIIYNKDLDELIYDTGTYVDRAVYYGDADDDMQLIEFSSLNPVLYNAEQDYHSLGAPIDFEYRLKYDSMGTPAQKKQFKKFFPIIPGADSTFPVQLAMDKDFHDSPRVKDVILVVNGAKWGEFNWGDGTLYGGDHSFKQHRQSFSGYAYYWQFRVIRKAVLNRVAFIGTQFSYKTKRL